MTLERARARARRAGRDRGRDEATKLTVYVGRHERRGGRPAHMAVVDALHRHGVAGATVLLGVDGTAHGARRARALLRRNADVPLMVVAVGDGRAIAAALPELGALLAAPLITLERVRVCKRDGVMLAAPEPVAGDRPVGARPLAEAHGLRGRAVAPRRARRCTAELVRALRAAGAAGATACAASGATTATTRRTATRFWQLRRRVPVVTVIVDTPERIGRWFAIVDALTDETGLVTSELVPAFRATGQELDRGGLRLARP